MKKMIYKLILWYMKRNNLCVVRHGKCGWKVVINFHTAGSYYIKEFTEKDVHNFEK